MEVISPTITIKVVGFFLGGLNLYILNKMKDTIFNGQKINLYYQTSPEINNHSFNTLLLRSKAACGLRLCSYHPRILGKINSVTSLQNQRRFYYISNISAINRIGPHNEDVLSVIIGSILGDAYAIQRTGEGVRICYRQSNIHKEYLFWLYNFL